jgi:enoyl-CoA hydratase
MAGYQISERAGALWFTFDREPTLNAVDASILGGLDDVMATAFAERPVALVITGRGRSFTVGGDLRWFKSQHDEAQLSDSFEQAAATIRNLERLPVPVIAAINGITTAGGMEITCFSDLVVASASAEIGDGHANYGLLPLAGSIKRLASRVGVSNAARLLLTGDLISAAEAQRMGLVHWVVEDLELEPFVEQLCITLAKKPPEVLEQIKRLLATTPSLSNEEASRVELQVALDHASSAVVGEGIAAFAEGREPRFRPDR